MEQILAKHKVTLSLVSCVIVIGWVWTMAVVVNTKENRIYNRLDFIELSLKDHMEEIVKLQVETERNRTNSNIIQTNMQMFRQDLGYIKKGIDKLWDRYDSRPPSHTDYDFQETK